MTQAPRCASCHGPLPDSAAFCPTCGTVTGRVAIEEMVPDQPAVEISGEAAMARRPWRAALLVAGVVIAVLAAGFFARFPSDDGASAPRTATTTAPASTDVATTSTTPALMGVCSTLPRAIRVPAPISGTLGFFTREGEVLVLDTRSGTLDCLRPVDLANDIRPVSDTRIAVWHVDGGTVMSFMGWVSQTAFLPDDARAGAKMVGNHQWAYPAGSKAVWQAHPYDPEAPLALDVLNVDGFSSMRTVTLPEGAYVWQADGRGSLVVDIAGSAFELNLDGSLELMAERGRVVGVGVNHVALVQANDAGGTELVLYERATGLTEILGTTPLAATTFDTSRAALSPDGQLLALLRFNEGMGGYPSPVVADLRSGIVTNLTEGSWQQSDSPFVWSTDSQWLLWLDSGGQLRAWSAADGTTTAIGAGVLPVIWDIFEMP